MFILSKSFALYIYDAVGNRIGSSQQSGTWQYNQDNQLTQQGEGQEKTSYTYTANGNIASETQGETSKTYTYDASDRLIRITSTANGSETEIARYAYDPMGRRIAKTIEGQTTYFLYADEGLIAEINGQGKLTKAYGWLADTSYSTSPLWQAEPQAGETTTSDLKQAQFHTLTTDHLGTVQMATNEAGQVTWKAQSEAFGKTMLDEKNQITMNLRFPGQYFDEETGTHYNYFRDYKPTTGRYIQRDPIGLQGGINTYAYVTSNPAIYVDANGLNPLAIPVLVGAGVGLLLSVIYTQQEWESSIPNTGSSTQGKCKSCESEYPQHMKCQTLEDFGGYDYTSKSQAQRVFGNSGKLHNEDYAKKGACGTDEGIDGRYVVGKHWNVRSTDRGRGSFRLGSITMCQCCENTKSGPVIKEKYRVHF